MIVRPPFSLRSYDLSDPEVLKRLPEFAWYLPDREAAWPLRGPRPGDKNPPRPPSNGRRARGARPS
jgi:hypothetical protein